MSEANKSFLAVYQYNLSKLRDGIGHLIEELYAQRKELPHHHAPFDFQPKPPAPLKEVMKNWKHEEL